MCSVAKTSKFFLTLFLAFSLIIISVPAFSATLTIETDGRSYIQLIEGGPLYPVSDFITGKAVGIPSQFMEMNSAERAAYVLEVASDQIENASTFSPQAAYDSALAARMAAGEAGRQARNIAQTSTNPAEVAQANAVVTQAVSVIDAAIDVQQDALNAGAIPSEGPGPEVPAEPEPEIRDTEPASPV